MGARSANRPAVVAAVLGALAEGITVGVGTFRGGDGLGAAAIAAIATTAVLVLPLLAVALVVAFLLDRRAVRALGAGVRTGLGGGDAHGADGHAGIALLAGMIVVGGGIAAGASIGTLLAELMTARFAAAGTAITTALVTLLAAVLIAIAMRPAGSFVTRLGARSSRAASAFSPCVVLAVTALVLFVVISATMPGPYAAAPVGLVGGIAIGLFPRFAERIERALPTRRFGVLVAALIIGASATVASLGVLPLEARLAVLYRGPWTSLVLGAARSAFDRDHDGYSAVLLGGDCDDANPALNPGARDVPGNGIDENCSGADARAYIPPSAPRRPTPSTLPSRMNVVLIQLDALRPDHLHFAGYPRRTSSRLDAFEKHSVWFENAYTNAPSTRFAMASAFTGLDVRRLPHLRGMGNSFDLLPGALTFAERLERYGYDRLGYTISYVIHHNRGLGQGFRHWDTPWPVDDWLRTYPIAAELTTRASIEYLRTMPEDGSKPFVLFAHYRCTHDPYFAYPRWRFGSSEIDTYDSALAYCDDEVGKMLDVIDRRGDANRTAVIMFSDHGELFGEHGLTNHGNSVYEPDVRILMLMRVPGVRAQRVRTPVQLSDLAPTVLELAGAGIPPRLDGLSLLAHVLPLPSPLPPRPLFIFTELWRGSVHYEATAVLDFPLKLIRDRRLNVDELFDVARDPAESDDLAHRLPKDHARLAELLESYEASLENAAGRP